MGADGQNNEIIGSPKLIDSEIQFSGSNNIAYFEEGVALEHSSIVLKGDNSVIAVRKSSAPLRLCAVLYSDSAVYIGKNAWTTNRLELNAGEAKHIVIGDDALLGSQCTVRTTDSHMLFSAETGRRINRGKSVFIGDHVWLAARVVLLKGAKLYSGCVIGSDSVVAGKEIPSNTVWAGNPARMIKSGVFFDKAGTHGLRAGQEDSALGEAAAQKYIYAEGKDKIPFDVLDGELSAARNAEERLKVLLSRTGAAGKNRFAKNPPQ